MNKENSVVVVEKRIRIGEVLGEGIYTWEVLEIMEFPALKSWCRDRGYSNPILTFSHIFSKRTAEITHELRASIWDVKTIGE